VPDCNQLLCQGCSGKPTACSLPHNFAAQYIRRILLAEIQLPEFVAFAQPACTASISALRRH
jgi:hypothetical protein